MEASAAVGRGGAPAGGPQTVLVVEDDTELRHLLVEALSKDAYRVVEAADLDGALERLDAIGFAGWRRDAPAAIVSDLRLPIHTGLDLLEVVRFTGSRIPFVLLTAFGDRDVRVQARRLGAQAVLDKPVCLLELRSAVRQVLAP
jgi:DNA-binding response OmpR family regulator